MSPTNNEFDDFEVNETPTSNPFGMAQIRMALARWWMIVIFALLGYTAALYTLSIAEPSHKASGVMEVVTTERHLVGDELEHNKLAMGAAIQTIASKLVGPGQLIKVVNSPKIQAIEKAVPPPVSIIPKYWRSPEQLNFTPAAEAEQQTIVQMITDNVTVVPRPGTTLIDIAMTHKDSMTAITVVDAIMEEYIATEQARKNSYTSDAYRILRDEANASAQHLEATRRSMVAYKSVLSTDAECKVKRDQLVLLKQRFKAKHPKMIEATALLANLKQRFRREIDSVLLIPSEREFWSPYRELMSQYDAIIADPAASAEEREVAAQKWTMIVQGTLYARISLLEGRIANKQAHYDRISQRIAEIDISEENSNNEIKIAENASSSGNVVLDKYRRLGQGGLGGAFLGFGVAYLLGLIKYKIYDSRTAEEATNLPCLSAVPYSESYKLEQNWSDILTTDPDTPDAEAYQNLRAQIMLLGKAKYNKVILIASAAPGEGKTTIASELAASFAHGGRKTCLIDLDFRKPRVHTLFSNLNTKVGMTDVLLGQKELVKALQKTSIDNLDVIFAGSKTPNPSELLQDDELGDIIKRISQQYDRVIIDTPPVLPVSDTLILVRYVQSVILVVRSLEVPTAAILRAKELLINARAPLVGVVLNAMPRKHLGSGYYGYRGTYGYRKQGASQLITPGTELSS